MEPSMWPLRVAWAPSAQNGLGVNGESPEKGSKPSILSTARPWLACLPHRSGERTTNPTTGWKEDNVQW